MARLIIRAIRQFGFAVSLLTAGMTIAWELTGTGDWFLATQWAFTLWLLFWPIHGGFLVEDRGPPL